MSATDRGGPPDSEGGRYALRLDEGEVERYRMMAEQARAAEADLWELAGIGPGARVADVGCGPGAMLPALSGAVGPDGRVQAVDADPSAVAAARGDDNRAGLRLADRLARAGLEVVEFHGRYAIGSPPPGVRPPPWAAREAMLAAGVVTEADVQRWDRAFREIEAAPVRPTVFSPLFTAVGRRPA